MINSGGHFYFPINLACFNRAKLMQSSRFVQIKLWKKRLNFHAYAVDIHKRNVQPECQKKPDEKRIVQNGRGSADGGKIFEHAPGNPEQEKQNGGTDARVAEIKEAETPDYLQKQLAEKQAAGQKFWCWARFAQNQKIGYGQQQV